MSEVLMKIGGVPVYLDPDGSVHFVGEFTIDCDGCPRYDTAAQANGRAVSV